MKRFLYCFIATSPWLFRSYFPINRFSDNYNKDDPKSSMIIKMLYRIKKYQYVFYKHFLLHGLNISLAWRGSNEISQSLIFQLYWLCLNTYYVMEFFLQTLVKKRYLLQDRMLYVQKILMLASTIAATNVLQYCNVNVCVLSLLLNFTTRQLFSPIHDPINVLIIIFISYVMNNYNQIYILKDIF